MISYAHSELCEYGCELCEFWCNLISGRQNPKSALIKMTINLNIFEASNLGSSLALEFKLWHKMQNLITLTELDLTKIYCIT